LIKTKDNDFFKIIKEIKQTRNAVSDLESRVNQILLLCTDQIKPLADNIRNIYLNHDLTKEIAYYKSEEYQESIIKEYKEKLEEELRLQQEILLQKQARKKRVKPKRIAKKKKKRAAKFIK
jgi:hypothetical protein